MVDSDYSDITPAKGKRLSVKTACLTQLHLQFSVLFFSVPVIKVTIL